MMIYLQVILYVCSCYACLKNKDALLMLYCSNWQVLGNNHQWVTDPLLNFTFESDFMISPQGAVCILINLNL